MAHSGFKYTCMRIALPIALLFSFFLPTQVSAQVVGATISGTVTDTSGSKMPGVDIVITNVGTGIATTTATKGEGTFDVPNLQPGNYEISASAKGFSNLVRKGITLTVGQELILNLSLQIGSVNEQVVVTAEGDITARRTFVSGPAPDQRGRPGEARPGHRADYFGCAPSAKQLPSRWRQYQ